MDVAGLGWSVTVVADGDADLAQAIAPELPPKTESDRVVPLTAEQASLYRATSEEILEMSELPPSALAAMVLVAGQCPWRACHTLLAYSVPPWLREISLLQNLEYLNL